MNKAKHSVAVLIPLLSALALVAPAEAGTGNLVRNPGFESGAGGWSAAWGSKGTEVVADAKRAHSGARLLVVTAEDANVGIDSAPIYAMDDFDPAETQVVSCYMSNLGVARGELGLRLYAYDADGKYVSMRSFGSLNAKSPKAGWQKVEAKVGPGTALPFPKELDHVVVRFSFWAKDGTCQGTVLIDDVFFGSREEELPAMTRQVTRTAKGAVAIWKDRAPAAGAASDPDHLAALLKAAGFGVNLVTTKELSGRAVLNSRNFDLLVLPYGGSYPAAGASAVRSFLRGGGNLIALGGRCFNDPLYPTPKGWVNATSLKANAKPPRPMVALSKDLVSAPTAEMGVGETKVELSMAKTPDGSPALAVVVPDLQTFKYIPFDVQGTTDYTIVHFRARGDEDTRQLCVELGETDHSRWKAIVDLSTQWRTYELSTGQFVSYASKGRGGRGDFFRAERAAKISFGFPSSLVGKGRRAFQFAEVQWRASDVPPQDLRGGSMLFTLSSDLVRAFGSHLKPAGAAGDITAFFQSQPIDGAAGLRAAPGQDIFPADLKVGGRVSGWTATILEDDLYFVRKRKVRGRRAFLPTEILVRTVPLLLTPDGRPAAALFVNLCGRYADSTWACFGVTSRDLFPAGDVPMGKAFVALAERMLSGVSITAFEPRFDVHENKARMQAVVHVRNRGREARSCQLHARLFPLMSGRHAKGATSELSLAPGETREAVVLTADADKFDWKHFRLECRLLADGKLLDRAHTSADVRGTLLALCDQFVATQRERGDGKFCDIAFVDNRGTRGLLAACDLTGRKQYLDAAVAWANAIVAEQRTDGGYLMGYGYHPDGNECFVADGGEIACGVARLISYVPERDKKRYMDSLTAYMGYRESFRCEGGGIGVGWCRSDYGARPVTHLKKTVKIFAPEMNIYTIGCTLAAAIMHAQLTRNPKDNEAAVRDCYWWMKRCKSTSGGAFVESAIWANRFLTGGTIKKDTEAFLRTKYVPHVVSPANRWWTAGGGRTVQGLDGLAYYYDRIEKDPNVLATLMRATYHICSPQSPSGIPRVLARDRLSQSEWLYLHFAAVSLPDLLQSEIVRKPF